MRGQRDQWHGVQSRCIEYTRVAPLTERRCTIDGCAVRAELDRTVGNSYLGLGDPTHPKENVRWSQGLDAAERSGEEKGVGEARLMVVAKWKESVLESTKSRNGNSRPSASVLSPATSP